MIGPPERPRLSSNTFQRSSKLPRQALMSLPPPSPLDSTAEKNRRKEEKEEKKAPLPSRFREELGLLEPVVLQEGRRFFSHGTCVEAIRSRTAGFGRRWTTARRVFFHSPTLLKRSHPIFWGSPQTIWGESEKHNCDFVGEVFCCGSWVGNRISRLTE